MNKVKKTLYSGDEMMERLKGEAQKILSGAGNEHAVDLSKKEIKELLHHIQVQHIELEMQNDELKMSNEQVESQRYKFESLYSVAPVGYFLLDKHGIIIDVNTTGSNQLEIPKRTILNRRFQSFISPDDTDLFYTFLRKILNSKSRQSCQLTLLNPKGDTLYAQIEGIVFRPSLDIQNEQCYIAVIDITERREAELKLKETKDRLEIALEASVAGTLQIDLRTEEISLDDFSCEIYGLKSRESIQTIDSFVKMIHPDDRRAASKRFGKAINHKKDLDVEYRIIKPDETIAYISARGHVIESTGGMQFVGILIDITRRKRLEKEALKLKAEHQKNLMAVILNTQERERKRISESLHDSVSQLLYGIRLKLQDYKKSDKDNKIFSEIVTLLDLAVKETRNISFELAPSILTDFGLVITLQEMAQRLSSKKLTIHTKCIGLKERLDLNKEVSIFRIIQELVNNAIKHAKATDLSIELIKKNKNLIITVRDNGTGFNNNELNVSGSGLHSIKNRLDLLSGQMDITSTESGTSINIIFKDIAL